jgi:hypothetical protein
MSDGVLAVLQPSETDLVHVAQQWNAHEFEPWVVAWNYWDENVVYSGGDDLKFKGWDIRAPSSPTFVDNKSFSGGVTSIQSSPYEEHIIAVGSYDESVRLFDTRLLARPSALGHANVGGGAWRVKWHPDAARKHDLLVACMHDGAKVVRFQNLDEPEVLQSFTKHESMVYGVDWSFTCPKAENGIKRSTVATTTVTPRIKSYDLETSERGVVGLRAGVLLGVGSTLELCPSLRRFQKPCSIPFMMKASVHLERPRRELGRYTAAVNKYASEIAKVDLKEASERIQVETWLLHAYLSNIRKTKPSRLTQLSLRRARSALGRT